jgi:hypothetical protein
VPDKPLGGAARTGPLASGMSDLCSVGASLNVAYDESAYQAGVAAAQRDIAAGQPKLRYGARGAWGERLAQILQARFGVELVVLACLTNVTALSFDAGYNATVEAHLDVLHGPGAVAAVWGEIEQFRRANSPAAADSLPRPSHDP